MSEPQGADSLGIDRGERDQSVEARCYFPTGIRYIGVSKSHITAYPREFGTMRSFSKNCMALRIFAPSLIAAAGLVACTSMPDGSPATTAHSSDDPVLQEVVAPFVEEFCKRCHGDGRTDVVTQPSMLSEPGRPRARVRVRS